MGCLDDDLAAEFVAGSLPPAVRDDVACHIDGCPTCRRLVAELARTEEGERVEEGAERYVLGAAIGSGAMGQVVRAHDRRLDREVAIKITRLARPEDELRFQREARALARLNHPNVVTVYDVFALDGMTCIAMEIVPGASLADWLASPPPRGRGEEPRWRTVCDLMTQVGRGLAAVHRAGLVHRDIKPSNILVTDDEVAKLADFGLVRRPGAARDGNAPSADALAHDLTITGAVVGTLGYMAPEVLDGKEATARSDQYSFCVTLYELIFGRRPFDGDSPASLRAALDGGVSFGREARRLPRRVTAVLRRGLATEPADRFDDIDALVRALPRTGRPSGRLAAGMAAGVVAAGALAIAVSAFGLTGGAAAEEGRACRRGEGAVDAVWSDEARRAVVAAFAGSGRPGSPELERTVVGALDRYAADWRAMHRASCEASASGEQSAQHLDRRMQCLIRARLALTATIDVIARADERVVDAAPDAVAALPPVADCGDFVRLEQLVALPPDPAIRRAVERVEAELARIRALADAGQLDAASDLVGPSLEAARATGYSPVLARALLAAGRSAMGREPALAEKRLREATRVAAGAGDATSEARAWVDLIETVGNQQGRVRDALALEHPASVAVGRVGSSLSAGALHLAIGMAHNVNGDQDKAIERYRQALPFAKGDPARLAAIHNNMGNAYRASGRDQLALEHLGLALEEYARSQHPGHTRVGIVLINQSSILRRRGDLPGAVAALERARVIIESNAAAEGSVKVQLAEQMAAVKRAQGHTDEAGRWYREALATARRVHGDRHIAVAFSAENYASFLAGEGRLREALELMALSIGIQAQLHGADSAKLAISYANRGEIHVERRAWADAIDDFSRVARLGGDRPVGVHGALELGKALARSGRRREALAALSDGIARAERTGEYRTAPVASARLAAASLLWRSPATRARAREQAGAALAAYRHLGDEARAAEAESWFRTRGTRPTSSPP